MKIVNLSLVLFAWLFVAECRNINSTKVTIALESIVIDSMPFSDQGMISVPDTGRHFKIKGIDSIAAFNVILQLFESEVMTKLPSSIHDSVLIVAGLRKDDRELVVAIDADNDKRIDDEKLFSMKDARYQLVKNVEYFDGIRVRNSDFYIKPVLSSIRVETEGGQSLQKPKPYDDPSVLVRANYRLGTFHNDEGAYKVALFNYLWPEYDINNSYLVAVPANTQFPDPRFGVVYYKVGDIFYLGENSYRFVDLAKDGSSVTFEQMPYDKKKPGVDSGYTALNIEGNDLLARNLFNLADSKKYTLLDFWGTWCGPCIATIPKLKSLNENRKQFDLQIVSIACNDDVEEVKQALRKEAISWTNLFDDTAKHSIAEKYRVRAFPTFILIDPEGKIVKRGSGELALDNIVHYLRYQQVHAHTKHINSLLAQTR